MWLEQSHSVIYSDYFRENVVVLRLAGNDAACCMEVGRIVILAQVIDCDAARR